MFEEISNEKNNVQDIFGAASRAFLRDIAKDTFFEAIPRKFIKEVSEKVLYEMFDEIVPKGFAKAF